MLFNLNRRKLLIWRVTLFYYFSAILSYIIDPYGLLGSYKKRLRIPRDQSCLNLGKTSRICIFVGFNSNISASISAYLEFIQELDFDILYVSNMPLSEAAECKLRSMKILFINRHNLGRDIGAYKDSILLLRDFGYLEVSEYLLLANDSVQFIPGNIANKARNFILSAISKSPDAIFSHVNYQHHKHFQSFFMIISRKILNSNCFISFWEQYIPLTHRGHSINHGEVALTSKVYSKYSNVVVLYSPHRLLKEIKYRLSLSSELTKLSLPDIDFMRNLLPTSTTSLYLFQRAWPYRSVFVDYKVDAKPKRLNEGLMLLIMEILENTNQAHSAAFLYPYFLSCPLIKKDLCSAGIFTMSAAIDLYTDIIFKSLNSSETHLNGPEGADASIFIEEFVSLLSSKGMPTSFADNRSQAIRNGINSGGFVYPLYPNNYGS